MERMKQKLYELDDLKDIDASSKFLYIKTKLKASS